VNNVFDLSNVTNGTAPAPLPQRPTSTDSDPAETREWLEALEALIQNAGPERAIYLYDRLSEYALAHGLERARIRQTPYINTIPFEKQPPYPGDAALEERLTAYMRWNALAMVMRANTTHGELGGHIASYASAADLFEVGFNHFFRAANADFDGDLVFFQPHSAPGVYARAFLEGFLSEEQLSHYRREIAAPGLCSYPHPWLMPDFWQFPTGSMGIGPINAIYQARFMRYLHNRGLLDTAGRKVWGFFGDGEMDEPESMGALSLAARERLDNLVFVINCNLQRLDGPVRSNGSIVQELESLFVGAGWNVIKVLWGSNWDPLFMRDTSGALQRKMANTVDGQYQSYKAKDGAYGRAKFFDSDPALHRLVAHMSDSEIETLRRGGHDIYKIHAAFAAAQNHSGQPTVVLAKTVKGYGLGQAGQAHNTTHQQKKFDLDALKEFRNRFQLPLSDADLAELKFYKPADNSAELKYLRRQRAALGGYLPRRREKSTTSLAIPPLPSYAQFALDAGGKKMSTTTAVVRMLGALLKDKTIGARIVPIVADEARTFGMANLFRQVGIYSPHGQLYEPEDRNSILYYRETENGQILEEGISEAGAISSWTAAATSYSAHNLPMIPFYIYYSIFGFQRVGDLIWAAADQRARGFLLGATSGRTTLGGEGLQHQDGSSQLIASTIPNCRAYDPAFAYELAVILDHGMREMHEDQNDVFYYITVMNENYEQPSMPQAASAGILAGMYALPGTNPGAAAVQLLGAGAIMCEVLAARTLLQDDWGIDTAVWSVTSFSELQREGIEIERAQRLGMGDGTQPYVTECLHASNAPVIAATDYVRAVPELIRAFVPQRYVTLGTDGFGRSDTRQALREFFEVDRYSIALAAIKALIDDGRLPPEWHTRALTKYRATPIETPPWRR
jgi:pyruvate dehydrogenase E1 component